MYNLCRNSMLTLVLLTLTACGHYGPLYMPQQAAAHHHQPTPTVLPKYFDSAKTTPDYGDMDTLTISEAVKGEEALNGT